MENNTEQAEKRVVQWPQMPPGWRVPCWLGSPAWVQCYLSGPTVDLRPLAVKEEVRKEAK